MDADFDYAAEFADARRRGAEAGHRRGDDDLAGLVAGRLRPLRPAVHPDELARRRHLPHRRRPRRRGQRRPALRPAQQLAGQRQPRQGAPPAVAGQAEVRPASSRGPTCSSSPATCALESMGFQTFGFGFGREDVWEPEEIFWGPEDTWLGDERYSGDRGARRPARRRADGPDLRQPGGPERRARPARVGPRHPRDVPPDGDERRGDRRAHRRRPHLRQDATAPATRELVGPEPEGCPDRGSRASAGRARTAPARARTRSPAASRAPGPPTPTQWDNGFFETPVRLRVGADQEPGRRQAVDSRRTARRRTPCPTRTTRRQAARADDADDRPRAAHRPGLRADLRRFLENPDELADAFARAWYKLLHRDMGPVSRYLGPWVRRRRSSGRTRFRAVDHELVGDGGRRRAQGARSSAPGCRSPSSSRTAWASAARFRGTDKRGGANGARIRLAPQKDWEVNEPAELAKVLQALEQVQQDFNGAVRRQARLARRPDRARRLRGRREGGEGRRARRHRAVHARAAPTPRRSRPTSSRSRCSSRAPTASATTSRRARSCRRRRCCSTGPTC